MGSTVVRPQAQRLEKGDDNHSGTSRPTRRAYPSLRSASTGEMRSARSVGAAQDTSAMATRIATPGSSDSTTASLGDPVGLLSRSI